jgi:phosphatidate cytidylyltransferase
VNELIAAIPLNPIAAKTLLILVSFFLLAGGALAFYEIKNKGKDENLRKRYFSWYFIAPVVLVPSYYGGLAFALLVLTLSLWCLREFFSIVHLRDDTPILRWSGRVAGLAIIASAFAEVSPRFAFPVNGQMHHVHIFYILPVFTIMLVLAIPVFLRKYQGMVVKESFTILGTLYFGWFLGHLVFLRKLPNGFGYVIFLTMTVVLNDVLAYTAGRLFGKHKLAPEISPKKTWEGALGGILGSVFSACVFGYTVPDLTSLEVITAALIIGIAAPLGDLIISVIKRDMAVKDSGTLIPGHGGLLDRCDSLIFATPAFYYFLLLVADFR